MLMSRLKNLFASRQTSATTQETFELSPSIPKGPPLLEKMIEDKPKFHLENGVLTGWWSIQSDTLRYLYSLLTPGMTTLETGCGQSTAVFCLARTNHICIMPDSGEAERVKRYCADLGLTPMIEFLINSSDVVLPCSDRIPGELDYVLIDGAHAFPAPIIDWHYTAKKLKIGGILSLDDYKMPSVKVLFDFLCNEEEWKLIRVVQNTAFFRKLEEPKDLIDWVGQKINKEYPGY